MYLVEEILARISPVPVINPIVRVLRVGYAGGKRENIVVESFVKRAKIRQRMLKQTFEFCRRRLGPSLLEEYCGYMTTDSFRMELPKSTQHNGTRVHTDELAKVH